MSTSSTDTNPTSGRSRAHAFVVTLAQTAGAGVCGASVLGHFDRRGIVFELMSHFRLQYAVVLVVACAALLLLRSFNCGLVVAVVAVTDLMAVAPYLLPRRMMTVAGAPTPVRLLSQNVNTSNRRYADVLALIEAEQPDLVLLMEVSPEWMVQLASLDAVYSYSCSAPRTDNFGIALWSRFELIDARIEPMTEARVPTIITDVAMPDGTCCFIGTHPLPPVNSRYLVLRNEQLELIGSEVCSRLDVPTIVAGDLNTTPWTSAFRDLLRDSGLRDTTLGRGAQRTWPVWLWPMRIPIDHVLATNGVIVSDRRVGADVGSDHLGVIADLILD